MIVQNRTVYEMTTDPLIYLLAFLLALAILFFLCATSVQASPTVSVSTEARAKDTLTLPANHKLNQFKQQIWYGDFSDISNERSGNTAEAANAKTLKGIVQNEGKAGLAGKIMGFFKSFLVSGSTDSISDAPGTFVSP